MSQPGIEPGSLAVKVASPKHPEEVPRGIFKTLTIFTEESFIVLTTLPSDLDLYNPTFQIASWEGLGSGKR